MAHILVVEDEPSVVELLETAITQDWGHTVTVARDGRVGYQLIASNVDEFDVILCDLHLPNMSGKQMLDRIGPLIRGRTPVIVMSGLPHLLEALRETRQRAFGVLKKPFDSMDHVRDTIQAALDQRRLLQAIAQKDTQIDDLKERVDFLAEQAAELLAEARRDPLTSLPTRIQLADDIRAIESTHSDGRSRAVLCLIDMDNFRRFNDEGGYGAGDAAIEWVANELERGSRDRDQIYRWGGDEFVALIPGATLDAGLQIADRLRAHVANASIARRDPRPITLSAGLVAIPTREANPLRQMIDEAATFLKRAKAAGGDKIASAEGIHATCVL